ncbi:MAG: phosphate ABC transporter ATP-binding protein [Methanomassiliicoccales archaeon]
MNTKIEAREVHLAIGQVEVLRGVSTLIPEGVIFTVVGPSGAGKSTFLRTLNRLMEIDRGDILLDGRSIGDYHPIELRKRVGMVFQLPIAFEGTVRDNVLMGPALTGSPPPDAASMMRMVGLEESLLDRQGSDLSVGQQQRMCIARAIANGPDVLLMDEPTSSLDPASSRRIENLIVDLKERSSLTMVVVTHDMEQGRRIGDRTLYIDRGRSVDTLPTEEFFRRYDMEDLQ